MISLYLTPGPPGWQLVTFWSGRRTLGRPAIIPTGNAWRASSATYRADLARNVGALTDLSRTRPPPQE